MRRALSVLAATGGVLALLANFHTSPAPSGTTESTPGTGATPSTGPAPSTTTTTTLPALGTTTPRSTTTTSPNPGATVDGPVATNEWGDVQVRVTLSGRRIIDVQALRLPHDNSHSAALSREAAPILRREALEAQSSQIDVVSGATLTSESYVESLQGALDRAGH